MKVFLHFLPTPSGTEFRLYNGDLIIPVDVWPLVAPPSLHRAIDILNRLVAEENALLDDEMILVADVAIAGFTASDAGYLSLPPLSDAIARVETDGLVTNPAFRVTLQWRRITGQPYIGAERTGAWLRTGATFGRLSSAVLAIAEAVDDVAKAADDTASRMIAIGQLVELLPAAANEKRSITGGLLPAIEVIQADAFSLDLVGSGGGERLIPILHRAGNSEPLLPPELQEAFGERQFNQFGDARSVYTLPGGKFLVISPTLRQALGVVRRKQAGTVAEKRALMAAPRAVLSAVLERNDDPTFDDLIERVFIDTPEYSDRVIGLGLWVPRVLPWVTRAGTDWFGPDVPRGLMIGSRHIQLSQEQSGALLKQVHLAINNGESVTVWQPDGEEPVAVPANVETVNAIESLSSLRVGSASEQSHKEDAEQELVTMNLLIYTNEGEIEHQCDFSPRRGPELASPEGLSTIPKPHQLDGIEWLQQAWIAGRPGVLLADDMGLGKTFQVLAFLSWLRRGMRAAIVEKGPILIVAPTGLLANWHAEHDRHLAGDGLGTCLAAFGSGLRKLRADTKTGHSNLNREYLKAADWILTTYETVRDYDSDFGSVRFSVLVADEAQKVKTPGARMTDALKGMNACFRIAMTGTPVENRLADLWCIVDGVHSGMLGDLRSFSRRYEGVDGIEKLSSLKQLLERRMGGAPPLLKRRMKEDQLPDLPKAQMHFEECIFPDSQMAAYHELLATIRANKKKGSILEGLQRLRSISLHPDPDMQVSDEEFVNSSARLKLCLDMLDNISVKGERALVFLDSLAMQARLAGLFQRRYALARPPAIISGEVPGAKRQGYVDQFQQQTTGFGIMILSPRAGGVGLTLTNANHVIHLSRWWNPAVEDQCTGRVLRIGQGRDVHVHVPIGILGREQASFDQNLHLLLERKRQLMRQALLPGGMSEAEQEELFQATVG